jgi:predicted ATPase with chaperone activity
VFRGLAGREDDCTDAQRQKYYAKISGPLLDRIDIQVDVPEVKFKDIVSRFSRILKSGNDSPVPLIYGRICL